MGTLHEVKLRSKVDVVPVSPCPSPFPPLYISLPVCACVSLPLCNRIFTAIMPMVAAGLIPDDPTLQPIRRLVSLVWLYIWLASESLTFSANSPHPPCMCQGGVAFWAFFSPTFVVFWLADCGAVLLSLSNGTIVDHKNQPVRIWTCSLLSSRLVFSLTDHSNNSFTSAAVL